MEEEVGEVHCITDKGGEKPNPKLLDLFSYQLDDYRKGNILQEISYGDRDCKISWQEVRGIPKDDDFFENVWREYRKNGNIF